MGAKKKKKKKKSLQQSGGYSENIFQYSNYQSNIKNISTKFHDKNMIGFKQKNKPQNGPQQRETCCKQKIIVS